MVPALDLVSGDADDLEGLVHLDIVVRTVGALGIVEFEDARSFRFLFAFAARAAPCLRRGGDTGCLFSRRLVVSESDARRECENGHRDERLLHV